MERVEALLTRKLVTSRELRALLPTVWWPGAQSQAGDDTRVSQTGFASAVEVGYVKLCAVCTTNMPARVQINTSSVPATPCLVVTQFHGAWPGQFMCVTKPGASAQALEKALDVIEQQQHRVVEALARAPRDELGDEDDDDGSDASSPRAAAAGGVQPDAVMVDESAPASAAVAPGSVIQRLMRALEGAGQPLRAAAAAQREVPGAGGGLAVGGEGEEGGGTALSAFLEHLITKNSGATRNIQPVGLSGAGWALSRLHG